MKYKVFCTITMQTEEVIASSEYDAKKKQAAKLGYPISCFEVWSE